MSWLEERRGDKNLYTVDMSTPDISVMDTYVYAVASRSHWPCVGSRDHRCLSSSITITYLARGRGAPKGRVCICIRGFLGLSPKSSINCWPVIEAVAIGGIELSVVAVKRCSGGQEGRGGEGRGRGDGVRA